MPGRNVVNSAAISRVSAAIRSRLAASEELQHLFVTAGVHEEEGSEVSSSGATIAAIAAFHEFGTRWIDRRSWLLDTISENEAAIAEASRRVAGAIIAGRLSPEKALGQLGAFVLTKIQARIRENIPPPLLDETIERKGSSVALIDEGRFIASIRAKVQSE